MRHDVLTSQIACGIQLYGVTVNMSIYVCVQGTVYPTSVGSEQISLTLVKTGVGTPSDHMPL